MKPTVGAILHYHPPTSSPLFAMGPFAAIVTRVHDGGDVAVHVFLPADADGLLPSEEHRGFPLDVPLVRMRDASDPMAAFYPTASCSWP